MNRMSLRAASFLAVVLSLLVWGCGKSAGTPVPFNTNTGAHPTTWIQDHWAQYMAAPQACIPCHGSTTDAKQAGGTSGIACFKCHMNGPIHVSAWALPSQHGRLGAELAPVATTSPTVPVMAGFAHCAKCHGTLFDGGLANVSCKSCHTNAPHPSKPWYDASGAKPSHTLVNPANATECVKCHAGGTNSTIRPTTVAAAGTAPGCFNATLCHSSNAHTLSNWIQNHWAGYMATPNECRACHGSTTDPAQAGGIARVSCFSCHANGPTHNASTWPLPANHGWGGAMQAPVATIAPTNPVMKGMLHCQKCHGTDFNGGQSGISCKSCHTTAPHPGKPWLPDTGSVALVGHPSVDPSNLTICAQCHARGANSDLRPTSPALPGAAPGCFNATLCHGG